MLAIIICGLLFSIAPDVESKSDYDYYSYADGWLKLHKIPATWEQASLQCQNEGAVLASPLTTGVRQIMQLLIESNDISFSYYIGANSKLTAGKFVSVEGISLTDMPVSDMYQELQTNKGSCLTIKGYKISVESCSNRFLYMCYKKKNSFERLTECGTFDTAYKLDGRTGSCYKLHRNLKTWFEANSLCVSEGGYLVILNNEQEAEIITAMSPDITLPWDNTLNWDPLFIGLKAWIDEGTWLTNHGQALTNLFYNWHEEQPNTGSGQKCGAITKLGKLDNNWCDKTTYFVCEKDPASIRYGIDESMIPVRF